MKEIDGIYSFNTIITLFTERRLKEKHLFNFELVLFLSPKIIGQR